MKSFLLTLIVLTGLTFSLQAQYYENPDYEENYSKNKVEALYTRKINQYQRVKKNGFIMMGAGAAGFALGLSVLNSVTYTYNNATGYYEADNPTAESIGVLLVLGGGGSVIGGTVMAILGNKKKKSYQRKLELSRISYVPGKDYHGLSLAVRF